MPTLDEAEKELADVSDRVSSRVRDLSIAMVAFGWSLLEPKSGSGSGASATTDTVTNAAGLRWVALAIALLILALSADFLQYALKYTYLDKYFKAAVKSNQANVVYAANSILSNLVYLFFALKIFLMIVAIPLILCSVAPTILRAAG